MTKSSTDQIEEIKKAENTAQKKLEKAEIDFDKKERDLQSKLKTQVEEYEKKLRESNAQKLEKVQDEADVIKKKKVAESEGEKNNLISGAKTKESDAVIHVVTNFMKHIKG